MVNVAKIIRKSLIRKQIKMVILDIKELIMSIAVRKKVADNRWVVPHNLYLSTKLDCHTNVEICSTVKAVKYIYIYISMFTKDMIDLFM